MEKKYLVIPGYVRSKTDGDRHYIEAEELMQLYGVNPKECVVPAKGMKTCGLIILQPDFSGKYETPTEKSTVNYH